jgi:hypothetical protein
VGGTLVGTWLGRLLERSNEARKWRRERCLEAYTEVFNSCQMVDLAADYAYVYKCESLEQAKQIAVITEKVVEMNRTLIKALLLGSPGVEKKLYDLTVYCGKEIATNSYMCPKLTRNEWDKIHLGFVARFSDCLNATRNDLGVFPKLDNISEKVLISKSSDK